MAKKKSIRNHTDHINSSIPYIAVLSVIAIVVFVITSTHRNLEVKNAVTQDMQTKTELLARGINPNPVSVRMLPLDYRWETSVFSYDARAVYMTSDIADFGDKRTELKIGTENKFLVVEVDTAYIKEMGTKQDIMVNKLVKLSSGAKTYQPVSADTVKLGPNQNTTSYVVFAVPMSATQFNVTTGNKLNKVDFSSTSVKTQQGVFLLTEGYREQF